MQALVLCVEQRDMLLRQQSPLYASNLPCSACVTFAALLLHPVAAVSKVQAAHAGGGLGKVTIPELKAFLRSVKQPVGGKKGELEERVRAWLGPAPTAAVALAGPGGAGE